MNNDPPINVRVRAVRKGRPDPRKRISVDHQQLVGADFSGLKLDHFGSIGSKFVKCRFDKMRIINGTFSAGAGREPSIYIDCSFDDLHFCAGSGGYSRFERCSFRNVNLRDWFCFTTEIVDCMFSGRLNGGIFNGTVPEDRRKEAGRVRNDFRGNDFSDMDLQDVAFRTGIDLSLQRLPSGPEYLYLPDASESLKRVRAEIITWSDLELRRQALTFIGTLEGELKGEQRQMLFRAADYGKPIKQDVKRVSELLQRYA